eukprot:812396-Alexandrium_andersonii.AAC.2
MSKCLVVGASRVCRIDALPCRPARTRRRIEEYVSGTPHRPYRTFHGITAGEVNFLRDVTHGVRP